MLLPGAHQKAKKHPLGKAPFSRRFRKGVGGTGLPPKRAQTVLQKCVPILLRGHRKKGTEKRPECLAFEGFPCANPLCPPTPFETSDLDRLDARTACKFQYILEVAFGRVVPFAVNGEIVL